MQHQIRPKLGNAGALFAEHPKVRTTSPFTWLVSRRWLLHIGAAAFVLIITSTMLTGYIPNSAPTPMANVAESTADGTIIDVVTDGEDGQLVGTLIHNQDDTNMYMASGSSKQPSLTDEERKRLLHIISN